MKWNPQRFGVETVRLDGVARIPTPPRRIYDTADSEQHEGCAMKIGRCNPTLAITALAVGLVAGANVVCAQIPCGYEVQIIQGPWCGEIFGYPPTVAKGISESGAIVGYYTSCLIGPSEAFMWTENTGLITLERPQGYTDAGAEDIDSATGWIVGALQTPGTDGPFAAVWADGKVFDLGTMPGGDFSNAKAIASNPNPIIVGNWGNENVGPIHGFVWQDGVMTDLGPILKANGSRAEDVNARGAITGWMREKLGGERIAYLLDDGMVTILGPIPGGFTSEGLAITSNSRTIVGVGKWVDRKTGDDFSRAFLWQDGQMTNLGTLPGFNHAGAFDVNDNLMVVGGASQPGGSAFIWHDGVMRDLNEFIGPELGMDIEIAYAISSDGHITGVGHDASGDVVALLLTPVEGPVGDLDNDCSVGAIDLLILLSQWGRCGDCDDCPADLNGDCVVGATDLLMLLVNWG